LKTAFDIALITGLGWSGSSALIDFLHDQNLISGIKSDYPSETNLFNGRGSPKAFLLATKKSSTSIQNLISLINGETVSLSIENDSKGLKKFLEAVSEKNNNQRGHLSISVRELENIITNEVNFNAETLNEFLTGYYNAIFQIATMSSVAVKKIIVFNNDLHLYHRSNKIFPHEGLRILFVRNVYDQIAERKKILSQEGSKFRLLKITLIVINLSIKIHKLTFQNYSNKKRDNTLIVQFEDFIHYKELRDKLAILFGANEIIDTQCRFDADKSKLNINIGENYLKLLEKILVLFLCFLPYKYLVKSNSLEFNLKKINQLEFKLND